MAEEIRHVNFQEVYDRFCMINAKNLPSEEAVIVYDPIKSNWKEQYHNATQMQKSYKISSDNKMFRDTWSHSLFGECLDPNNPEFVKLSDYDWVIDYCYFVDYKG